MYLDLLLLQCQFPEQQWHLLLPGITNGLMNGLAVRANSLVVLSLPMILGNLCNVPRSAATPMSVS